MRKVLALFAFLFFVFQAIAQTGAGSAQELGKILYTSFKTNNTSLVTPLVPTLAELKVIKGANDTKEDSILLKVAKQAMDERIDHDWLNTKTKLESNGVLWDKAETPAVSYEPFQGSNQREWAIVQVMFKVGAKSHVLSVKCTTVDGRWYIVKDIKPEAQQVD